MTLRKANLISTAAWNRTAGRQEEFLSFLNAEEKSQKFIPFLKRVNVSLEQCESEKDFRPKAFPGHLKHTH